MRARVFAISAAWVLLASCGVLAHPVSNDGSDTGNPNGVTSGGTMLTISASRSNLGVGDTASILGSVGGQAIANNGSFVATSSDPTVLFVGGTSMFARSVGSVTITATDNGYQATMGVTVHAAANGTSATIDVTSTDPPTFSPNNLYVTAGSAVQFVTGTTHNVVFDVVSGAPQNVPVGAGAVIRTFSVVGAFTYSCTVHGETGVVNVTP
jgi:plastocyanin